MDEEFKALTQNEVWEMTDVPKGQTIIDCKWTYKLKRDANGNVQRYKARLVARGFRQKEGIDYHETYSPIVRFDSIRTILAIAACRRMDIQKFDVKTAFLYGKIEEEIYMKQPEGYEDGTDRVCKLKRSLYLLYTIRIEASFTMLEPSIHRFPEEIRPAGDYRRSVRIYKPERQSKAYSGNIYR